MKEREDNLEWYKNNPYIQTFTGKKFHFLDPQPDEICIEDIAHALSNNCRYAGHCKIFYSVAEHSWLMSNISINPLWALLHDASEAYIVDIPRPIKGFLTNYHELESNVMKAICRKFSLEEEMPEEVKELDGKILFNEKEILLEPVDWGWKLLPIDNIIINCYPPKIIKTLFIEKFNELWNKH